MLIFIYIIFQLIIPLRHVLYPGSNYWTEEGHRFSWSMKGKAKLSEAHFYVSNPEQQVHFEIQTSNFLSPNQRLNMEKRPDMILQFAHFLAQDMEKNGLKNPVILAEVYTSLNGHAPRLLINPETNLALQSRSLRHAEWILSFEYSPTTDDGSYILPSKQPVLLPDRSN